MTAQTCDGCGAPAGESAEQPRPAHCGSCPPEVCGVCGGINHIATNRMCSCWVDIDTLAHADLKALFAHVDLSLGTPNR